MAGVLSDVVLATALDRELFSLLPSTNIGGIAVQTSIDEVYTDRVEITEQPVEAGAAITDHSYQVPSSITLRCGWSNSGLAAIAGIVTGLFSGGGLAASNFVSGIYSQLLALQQSRQPIEVSTGLRQYDDMIVTELTVRRDRDTAYSLMVEATLREIITVTTQSALLPPQQNQADPQSTAETQNLGYIQPSVGSPNPGGSLPPANW